MNDAKHDALLQGQSTLARKVYDAVPIQEAWTPSEIQAVLRATQSTAAEARVVHGCLRKLTDDGLIREVAHNKFRRRASRASRASHEHRQLTLHKELPMPANAPKAAPKTTPLELLSELANDIKGFAQDVNQRLQNFAIRTEDIALAIEQQRELDNAELAKLRQLQSLLKSLGEPA